jgi:acyl carrier protein
MKDRLALRAVLEKLLLQKGDRNTFSDGESLLTSGRLDSVDTLELVVLLEQDYGIDFSNGFDRDDLDSVDSILNLIQAQPAAPKVSMHAMVQRAR